MQTMAKKTARNRGGRPRSKDRSALTAALIERQDAQSRQTAARIADLVAHTLPAVDVAREWAEHEASAAATIRAAYESPETVARVHRAAIGQGPVGVELELKAIAYPLLRELAGPGDQPNKQPAPRVPPLAPSRSLAEARARSASLQAEWIELKNRVAWNR